MYVCNLNIGYWADFFAILTGLIACFWFMHAVYDRYNKRKKLENYLLKKWHDYDKRKSADGNYRHSIVHLMAELGLTSDEVLQASFRSKKIVRRLAQNDKGIATDIRLQHAEAKDI